MTSAFPLPALCSDGHVLAEIRGAVGLITLNRPQALNALSLPMVRDLRTVLEHWRHDPAIAVVVVQGAGRPGKAPAFCAGGDIRFFHQAALAGDPRLEDFFTEEYALNHAIHHYPKPYVAFMDGICMGGGMGISQGAQVRVVTQHSKLAMPETQIGLFPDVGGGWFLARCAGHLGEYLAVTGRTLDAAHALGAGLADICVDAGRWPEILEAMTDQGMHTVDAILAALMARAGVPPESPWPAIRDEIDQHFAQPAMRAVEASLLGSASPFAQETLAAMQGRSPLMMAVSHEQVRRARMLSLAEDLRMERDLVRQCFQWVPGPASETVEGIRALAVDKDHAPRWRHQALVSVSDAEIAAYFTSPWPALAHPLRDLV